MFRNRLKCDNRQSRFGQCLQRLILTSLLALIGCGKAPDAEFQYRETTLNLIPDAQKAVKKSLVDGFGTPSELVAWERFPVSYGGVKGTVGEANGTQGSGASCVVTFEGDGAHGPSEISKGAPILWLSGPRSEGKESVDTIASFDSKTNALSWKGPADPRPATGDRFVIGYGETLKTGRKVYMKNCMHCHGVSG
ncbi:MAG: cytochrome c, partial [Planctomycetes bacterium]|nr:cytochrome c [Planctomycetota bacterium]